MQHLGGEEIILPVRPDGVVDDGAVDAALARGVAVLSVMWVNNETGTIQPIAALARKCHAAGVPFHCDAVQAFGKIPVSFSDLPCTLLTLSGHKIGASKGIGALVVRERHVIEALIHGGGQQFGIRPGTENVPGIVALGLLPCAARAQALPDTVTLAWTAPGDDGNVGTAAAYEMRMSGSPIDEGNWTAATVVSGLPAPLPAGAIQRVVVRGLTYGTTYYFALKTADEAGNWSALSNVMRWEWIYDTTAPAAPLGLAAAPEPGGGVRVSWSPNAEPDLEKARDTGANFKARSAARRSAAAVPGAGAGATPTKLQPPPKQGVRERIQWLREKFGNEREQPVSRSLIAALVAHAPDDALEFPADHVGLQSEFLDPGDDRLEIFLGVSALHHDDHVTCLPRCGQPPGPKKRTRPRGVLCPVASFALDPLS